ncbi:MAG: ABC transporter permease [Deltaproteobacteria bacterium]
MNYKRVLAMTGKEFIQIIRDWRSLGLALLIPVFMLILFGYALTLDVDNVPLAVWDQDKSVASRDFIRLFSGSPYFKVAGYVQRYGQIEDAIDNNSVFAGLVIPRDFSALLSSGRASPVQLILDGSNSNTASITLGYAQGIVLGYNLGLSRRLPPVDLRPRVWFNPDLRSRNYIVPGLIAIIMMVVGGLLTGLTVSREWERGTMEQLISTPVHRSEIILGKLIPYFCLGITDVLIAVLMGIFLFGVPLRGSIPLLFCFCALFLAGVLGQGILISIVTRNQFLSTQLVFMSTFLPAFLLSGFAFPIANMPAPVQAVTYLVPARYLITVLRGIYLKGVGLAVLWPEAVFLALFAALMLVAADRKFIKKVA